MGKNILANMTLLVSGMLSLMLTLYGESYWQGWWAGSLFGVIIGISIVLIFQLKIINYWQRTRQFPAPSLRVTLPLEKLSEPSAQISAYTQQEIQQLVDNAPIGITCISPQGKILWTNTAMLELLGYTPEESLGYDITEILVNNTSLQDITRYLSTHEALFNYEAHIRTKNNQIKSVLLDLNGYWKNGKLLSIHCFLRDITERKKTDEQIYYLANHDPLTGLFNRAQLAVQMRTVLAMAKRHGQQVAILFFDLDGFKHVNDTLGHQFGDSLLIAVAQRLQSFIRSNDILARLGGDEFVLVATDIRHVDDVTQVVKKILAGFKLPFDLDGHAITITTSIGISLYPTDAETEETLLRYADTAMYRAKEMGKDNYQFYTQEMANKVLARVSLERGMRRALKKEEFSLYYQPQIDLITRQVIGVEALLRWHHPQKGLLQPAAFISIAEDNGLIVPMGEWVLETACQQMKIWQTAGYRTPKVAVNISPQQLREPRFAETILKILAAVDLEPQYLELEITESCVMRDPEQAIVTLKALRGLGVQLAIDDFGKGYSSLNYLKQFPLHRLKIDRSFIQNIPAVSGDTAIVEAIIAIAHRLKLKVMAEGVENHAQLEFLRTRRCDEIQGFFHSQPMSADMVIRLFNDELRLQLQA